ncbi:hypothetical protein KCG44_04830 [Pacificimonas sp. WHA3]|uniref:SMODS and SLOG-associating 2TM effector domain-containing protein n=1 Tax=Pacificimonas pallii TaxID=2827236 RepID=A0ABS6SCG0_9SPHN|nr:hypothetical protein [Pacificimonas pallii]MBV7256107.1 hypothetical protein [Pacificimonas pallii]
MSAPHPPRPALALNVGVTGHRTAVMPEAALRRAVPHLHAIFGALAEGVERLHDTHGGALPSAFAETPPRLVLHSPMATGADQMAAEAAKAHGFRVRALLPFERGEYANDFAAGPERETFRTMMADADSIFTLPGKRENEAAAYVSTGHTVVAKSDILIAIWDGKPSRGEGGTGHIVQLAAARGTPVIHIPVSEAPGASGALPVILGAREDLHSGGAEPAPPVPANIDTICAIIADRLGPPTDIEKAELESYFSERERRTNARIEYPLLLALTGVKKLTGGAWRQDPFEESAAAEWKTLRARTVDAGPDFAQGLDVLERAYGWANGLAIHYAQLFRSGHVMNYCLAAFAVMLALTGLVLPDAKFYLVIGELVVIGLLFYSTRAGHKGDWHRRWLQYRYLAETLRPLPYLRRTGVAIPPFLDHRIASRSRRADRGTKWTKWYAGAIWRQMPDPAGVVTDETVTQLSQLMIEEQLEPQASYHRVNAHRMHDLDHRLHQVGNVMMGTVIAACLLFVVGYLFFKPWIMANVYWFVIVTAGLPAIGAAVYGIRGHGEFVLAASRSHATAHDLEISAARLRKARDLDALAEELESAAGIMLADLGEWTMAYQERELAIPA